MSKRSIRLEGWVYAREPIKELLDWIAGGVKDNVLYGLKSSVVDAQGVQLTAKRLGIRITVADIPPKTKKAPVGRPSLKALVKRERAARKAHKEQVELDGVNGKRQLSNEIL